MVWLSNPVTTGRWTPVLRAASSRCDGGVAAEAPETITPADVGAELARRSLLKLPFPPAIEARYEADTKAARAWNIRLTVPMGLIAYIAFSLTDGAILPDLGWLPVACRICVAMPAALFAMWMCSRLSAGFREAFISYAITGTMMIPVGFIALSRAGTGWSRRCHNATWAPRP